MAAIMQGLDAEAYDRQYDDKALLKRIISYFMQHRGRLGVIVVCNIMLAVLAASQPLIIRRGIEEIAERNDMSLIPVLIVIITAVGFSVWAVNWVYRIATVKVLQGIVLSMRTDAFDAAARQDMSFYDEFSSGRIVSRITSDTDEFGRVAQLSFDLVQQVTTALILVITLMVETRLALILLAMAPITYLLANGFRALARRTTRQSSRALGEVNKSIQEAVTGIGVAKNFRQEQAIYDGFHDINVQAYRINIRRSAVIAAIFPAMGLLLGFMVGAIVYFGGQAVITEVIAISAWYLLVSTLDRFWFPLVNLSSFWSQFQQGLSAVERVFALVDAEPVVVQQDSQKVPPLDGRIDFEHVAFRYKTGEQILPNFTLTIEPGETIAIVGHTGAGKSSIIKLVSRFYEFQGGKLSIDGFDIRDLDLTQYRSQLGIVSQVPFLFNGTVADNVRFGRPDITDAQILKIAHRIGRGEWLETLPDGIETNVGERGSQLSMGQRQLVALTRVLAAEPAIFIFDEATANIDPFTESQIQEALQLVMENRTSIVIAHRLSTVKSADRILVLDQGDIIEQGSHDQLMAQGGNYADLYNTYFRHQSLEAINNPEWLERWQKRGENVDD